MERFRGLRGLVQRLGGGDAMPIGGREQTEEILENLPLTRAFVERLPRSAVIETAAENDAKAIEALHLVKRVDELVESHASAARDLREYVSQISSMKASIDQASDQATYLHQQLLDLDAQITQLEAAQEATDLQDLQAAEDAKFETYAQSRRADLALKKHDYAAQLASFERERISVLSQEFASAATLSPKRPAKKAAAAAAAAVAVAGLESVTIAAGDAGELDDFFAGGGGGQAPAAPSSAGAVGAPKMEARARARAKAAVRGRGRGRGRNGPRANPHLGIMEDEDIEDGEEEARKWY